MATTIRYLYGPTADGVYARVTYDDAGSAQDLVTLVEWQSHPTKDLLLTIDRPQGNVVNLRVSPASSGSLTRQGNQRFDWQTINFNISV